MADEEIKRLKGSGSPIDYTGQRFGKLTALEYIKGNTAQKIKAKWRCQCDCGNVVDVDLQNLRLGIVKACYVCEPYEPKKRGKIQNIVGQKYGKLTVLDQYDKDKKHICYCRCVCGTEKEILYYNLIYGKTKTCGCGKIVLQGPKQDLTGFKKGKITVLNYDMDLKKWNCLCSCGKVCQKSTTQINYSSDMLYCGDLKCHPELQNVDKTVRVHDDLTNKVFGDLTVLYRVEDRIYSNHRHPVWHCKCVCGNELDVLGWNLKSGEVNQCTACKRQQRYRRTYNMLKENKVILEPIKEYKSAHIYGSIINSEIKYILNLPHNTEEELNIIKIKFETLKELKILTDVDIEYYLLMLNKDRFIENTESIEQVRQISNEEQMKQVNSDEQKAQVKHKSDFKEEPVFYKISEFAELVGITRQTLINWSNTGRFKEHHRTPSGHRYYSEEQLLQLTNMNMTDTD